MNLEIKTIDAVTLQCGGIIWRAAPKGISNTVWRAELPNDAQALLSTWIVKDYGGAPEQPGANGRVNNPFSGWRVVGGGPFTDVGGWTNRDDAIRGATPWIVDRWMQEASTKVAAMSHTIDDLRGIVDHIRRAR